MIGRATGVILLFGASYVEFLTFIGLFPHSSTVQCTSTGNCLLENQSRYLCFAAQAARAGLASLVRQYALIGCQINVSVCLKIQ